MRNPYLQPNRSSVTRERFNRYASQSVLGAAALHVVFLLLFAWLGVESMAWLNVASLAIYVGAYWLLQRPFASPMVVLAIVWVELVGHASAATWLLGWDSGFHYYLLMLAPLLFADARRGYLAKAVYLLAVMLLYVGVERLLGARPPDVALADGLLDGLRYLNMTGTAALLAFLTDSYARAMRGAEQQLRIIASLDPLTQLSNRRHLTASLVRRTARQEPLGLVLGDVDHFKQINDRFGHAAGDAVLVEIAAILRDSARQADQVARWGGEEFLLLVANAGLEETLEIAERLRRKVEAHAFAADGQPMTVSLSLGVAVLAPQGDFDAALHQADQALYRAKAAGRNRVEGPRTERNEGAI